MGRTKILAFVAGVLRRFGPSPYLRMLEVNGEPAAQFSVGGLDSLVGIEVRDGEIVSILTVLNPDELSYLHRQTGGAPQAASG
jgi:RNA polymerase sigma-70 factor (ECF subfamily)